MKKNICKFAILFFVIGNGSNLFSQNSNRTRLFIIPNNQNYVNVTIFGRLITKQFYGPPNYGETPQIDSIETHYVLQLSETITFRQGSFTATVGEIQLIFNNNNTGLITGRNYVIDGEAFFAETGHHHTPIIISVNRITRRD